MKILLTSLSGQYGGMEIRMLQEASVLKGIGHTVEIGISSFPDQERFFKSAQSLGVYCFTLDIPPFFEIWKGRHFNLLKAYLLSAPHLKKQNYDLAHIFMPWTDQSASRLWVCTKAGIPAVMSIHGNFSNTANFPSFHKRILRTACHSLRGIFSVSESAKRSFLNNFRQFVDLEIEVIPNFVDSQRFRPNLEKRNKLRRLLKIANNAFVLGYIGRLATRKHIDDALEAFSEFHCKNENSHFIIVGDGPELFSLRNLVDELGISNCVHFLGFQSAPEDFFPAFDTSILLSEEEGFGISVIESMSCEVPIICTNVPGLSEIVTDSHNGFLVNRTERNTIANRLAVLNDNPIMRGTMGTLGRQLVLESFDYPIFSKKISDFYSRNLL